MTFDSTMIHILHMQIYSSNTIECVLFCYCCRKTNGSLNRTESFERILSILSQHKERKRCLNTGVIQTLKQQRASPSKSAEFQKYLTAHTETATLQRREYYKEVWIFIINCNRMIDDSFCHCHCHCRTNHQRVYYPPAKPHTKTSTGKNPTTFIQLHRNRRKFA